MFAIIVPYRDREFFLSILLEKLTDYLEGSFIIIVSQQKDSLPFNLGLSRNIGAVFAECYYKNISHFIFNDVDTIPLKSIDYLTPENIIHFINFGSCKIIKDDFFKINGYNPLYNGWGHEDNDFYERFDAFDIQFKKEFLWQGGMYQKKKYINLELEHWGVVNRKDKWDIKKMTDRNEKMFNFFRSLDKKRKQEWASIQGANLIDPQKIKLENKFNNIYTISYNSIDYI
jgi:hypothetical protein